MADLDRVYSYTINNTSLMPPFHIIPIAALPRIVIYAVGKICQLRKSFPSLEEAFHLTNSPKNVLVRGEVLVGCDSTSGV